MKKNNIAIAFVLLSALQQKDLQLMTAC